VEQSVDVDRLSYDSIWIVEGMVMIVMITTTTMIMNTREIKKNVSLNICAQK
jgi:hypothetical protein